VPLSTDIRVRVFDQYDTASRTLLADLTDLLTGLTTATKLHGGFSRCTMTLPMSLGEIWGWLQTEAHTGRHFAHVEVRDAHRLVWEGRLMEIGYDPSIPAPPLELGFLGYWSSCRDQLYDPGDAGNTNWTTSGPHTIDDIIKEFLTGECPDINTDQTHIIDTELNVVGIDLTDRDYPMNIIVDKLPMTTDGTDQLYFAIWDDRIPYLTKRAVSPVTWTTYRSSLRRGSKLSQDVYKLRNSITPVVDGTEGTETNDTDSQATYPKRELLLTVQKGIPTAAENEERDRALAEKKDPHQSQAFTIGGPIYDTRVAGQRFSSDRWWVRAGDVIRISDLIPSTAASPALDNLRTFFILETQYNWFTDILRVMPDRAPTRLSTILSRTVNVEPVT